MHCFVRVVFLSSLIFSLCAAHDEGEGTDNGATIVYAHRLIRPNADYEIVAQSLQKAYDADITATIQAAGATVQSKTVTVEKGDRQTLRLRIPSLPQTGSVTLKFAVAYKDFPGQPAIKEHQLIPVPSDDIILIQLNKPMYRATDAVQFRVLILDQQLRLSSNVKTITALLKDPQGGLLETKADIGYAYANTPGFFNGTFQPFSFDPVNGNWTLEIVTKGQTVTKVLQVANYRLPRFAVYFNTPDYVTPKDVSLTVSVSVRDQTGNPVIGSVETVIIDPSMGAKPLAPQDTEGTSTTQPYNYKLNHQALQRQFCDKGIDGYIILNATAKEKLTNKVEKSEKRIPYYCTPVAIHLGGAHSYRPGLENTITVRVTNHDGTPVAASVLSAVTFSATESGDTRDRETPVVITGKEVDVAQGIVTLQMRAQSSSHKLMISATLEGITKKLTLTERLSTVAANIRVFGAKTYRVGDTVEFQLECNQECPDMYYSVLTRNGVAASQTITMTNEKSARLSFKVTASMAPSATIIAYYLGATEIGVDSVEILVERGSVVQDVTLTVGPEDTRQSYVVPGLDNKAKVEISATPNSLVGLLAVDKNLLQLASGHDITARDISSKLFGIDAKLEEISLPEKDEFQAKSVVVSVFDTSLLLYAFANPEKRVEKPSGILRNDFRDSFMFTTGFTDAKGKLSYSEVVPDSITTWAVTAFAASTKQPISLTKKPQDLRVYQELYIHLETPLSMIENETTKVNVTLFNFRSKSGSTTLGFRYTVNASRGGLNLATDLPLKQRNAFQYFPITLGPYKKGIVTVTVEVFEQGVGTVDKVVKHIHIIQPGALVTKTSDMKTLTGRGSLELPVDRQKMFPENVVPGSESITLTVTGDVWAPTMKHLSMPDVSRDFEGLIRIPMGCGEQTMAVLMPNVFLARYLKRLGGNALTANNRDKKLRENMYKGFIRQASFRLKDGSYNAFGRKDHNGSTWLTGYVVRGMALASEFIRIDKTQIDKSLAFLDTKQNSDGSFREDGNIIDRPLAGAGGKGVALTAFVLLGYIENGRSTPVMNKARAFLESALSNIKDPFTLGLTCYAFSRMGSAKTQECIQRLNDQAKEPAAGQRCWLDKSSTKGHDQKFTAKDVETTAYALLALCNSSYSGDLSPIVDWLLSQRNGQGGFKSTMDTIVALNALSELKAGPSTKSLNVEVVGVKGGKQTISPKVLVPKTFPVPLTQGTVQIKADGEGTVKCQLEYSYRERPSKIKVTSTTPTSRSPLPNDAPESDFDVGFKLRSEDDNNNNLQLDVCPT
ncbi:CD109 antigen-like [Paramacrobiotus metropolitanus]|uniref:CD109 antigen-like n=1 Tax=Paramacrobiotus metropolitanus TaxID=2943436 RepID=UPI002445F1D2|nr:CD109 antigen-like [Paramacrobiotus metropolitanus]